MVEDTNDELPEIEDDEAESEVDKVLEEVLKTKLSAPEQQAPVEGEAEEENREADLEQMRGRLEALKS
ncbi:Vacuolar protein-sorting-associated protein 24 [Exophiala oligosperma]